MVHEDGGCCISNPSIMRVRQTLWASAVHRHQTSSCCTLQWSVWQMEDKSIPVVDTVIDTVFINIYGT